MADNRNKIEGLWPEDRQKLIEETEEKYESIINELEDLIEYVDDQFSKSFNSGKKDDMEYLVRSLSSIIHIHTKLLTDTRLILNKIYNEHSVELLTIRQNLEILNENISILNKKDND